MLPRILIAASAAIMVVLGGVHLVYTYGGTKLLPRDAAVQEAMSATPLGLTSETTVWRAWVGFNASHSVCAIFFGLVYGILAVSEAALLARSGYLQVLGLAVLVAFVVLARLYWFTAPLVGVSLALALYLAGALAFRL